CLSALCPRRAVWGAGRTLRLFLLQCNIYIGPSRFFANPPARHYIRRNGASLLAKKSSAHAAFPAPGHDHDRCASDAIAHAETLCAARSERLTPIRRGVLSALLASHKPLGAY